MNGAPQLFPVAAAGPLTTSGSVEAPFSSFNAAGLTGRNQATPLSAAELQRAAEYFLPSSSEDDASDADEPRRPPKPSPTGGLQSAAGDDGDRDDRRKRKKEKKRKHGGSKEKKAPKRPKTDLEKIEAIERQALAAGDLRRGPAVAPWATSAAATEASGIMRDLYRLDLRGDRNNVVYDGLYQMDVAAYRRVDPAGFAIGARPRQGPVYGRTEADGEQQRGAAGRKLRYFMAKQVLRETDDRLPRVRLAHKREVANEEAASAEHAPPLWLPAPSFLPLRPDQEPAEGAAAPDGPSADSTEGGITAAPVAETAEQATARRTREFNVATRKRPQDLQLWLDFAAFQDDTMHGSARHRKGMEAGTAEKKIAILERGLEHHPGSEELLLALLNVVRSIAEPEEVARRWRSVLAAHPGSARLWREYLAFRRAAFATFGVAAVRREYEDALEAMHKERGRLQRKWSDPGSTRGVEDAAMALLVDAAAFDLRAGFTELAVARIQAALEFNLFRPASVTGRENEKLAAFKAFWSGDHALIGEPGARGWAHAVALAGADDAAEMSNGAVETATPEEPPAEDEPVTAPAGWAGWQPLATQDDATVEATDPAADAAEAPADPPAGQSGDEGDAPTEAAGPGPEAAEGGSDGDDDSDDELAPAQPEEEQETEEELLAQLGIKLDEQLAALEGGPVTPDIAARWVAAESRRCADRWQPLRRQPAGHAHDGDADGGSDAGAVVKFWEVEEGIFSLGTAEQRGQLALRLLRLLDVPLDGHPAAAPCSNDPRHVERQLAADAAEQLDGARLLLGSWSRASAEHWEADGASASTADDNPLAWLAPQTPPGAAPRAWYRVAEPRRAFAARLLARLLAAGPDALDAAALPAICSALMRVEAAPVPPDSADEAGVGETGDVSSPEASPDFERARSAAKALLETHRDCLPLWAAYARLETAAGQHRAARRVYHAALAAVGGSGPASGSASGSATVSSGFRGAEAAALVVEAAEAELQRGGADARPRALHLLTWLGAGGPFTPYSPPPKGRAEGAAIAAAATDGERLQAARRGFQENLPAAVAQLSRSAAGVDPGSAPGGNNGAVESPHAAAGAVAGVAAAALFEELLPAAGGSITGGVLASARLIQQVLAAVPEPVRRMSAAVESLQVRLCRLLTLECFAGNPLVPPRTARQALKQGLDMYPRNPELLAALAEAEFRAHTPSRLRRDLAAASAAAPSPFTWLLALRCEAQRAAATLRLQGMFERTMMSAGARSCPLLWRCYVEAELSFGRPQAARRVFLRAIHECPGSQVLWWDGLGKLTQSLGPSEAGELLTVLQDKGVCCRTDVYEVQLAAAAEAAGIA